MQKRFLIVLALLITFTNAMARHVPSALKILEEMHAYYQKLHAFKATFTCSIKNSQDKKEEIFVGEIAVKGVQYHCAIAGQEIFNNGETVWNYLKESREVTISAYDPDEEGIHLANIYAMYQQGYKAVYLQKKRVAKKSYAVIDLIPVDKDNAIAKMRLTIDLKTKTLQSWTVLDQVGTCSIYLIKNFEPNTPIDDTYFNFHPENYEGVEVIDLR